MRVTMRQKDGSSESRGTSGGLGCLFIPLWVLAVTACVGLYYWSGGMDAREAVGIGLMWGAKSLGVICIFVAVLFGLILAAAIFK